MLYATLSISTPKEFFGHVGDSDLEAKLNTYYSEVVTIQASGHELFECCQILGRSLPKRAVYTFAGANAQEIAANWRV